MNLLFPIDDVVVPNIPGLSYRPDFITESDEQAMVSAIDAGKWDTTWDRRRQPFGASYGRAKSDERPIPAWGQRLAKRISSELGEPRFDQMLVNEYLPGQGIALHRDYDPFDRTVVSLSLLAPCVMDFRHSSGRRESLLLMPRSLLVLSDEARYDWEHGIARRKADRWDGMRIPRSRRLSVTFRRLVKSK